MDNKRHKLADVAMKEFGIEVEKEDYYDWAFCEDFEGGGTGNEVGGFGGEYPVGVCVL